MPTLRDTLTHEPTELTFGTSGLRALVTDMTDLECYINTTGFLRFLKSEGLADGATIYLAGDLRHSTPRIMSAVHQAIADAGYKTVNCEFIPTPAVAYYALQQQSACIMVTGSHIPDDRNGIKFYKTDGEVLKADEVGIKQAVAAVRAEMYNQDAESAAFTPDGSLKQQPQLPPETKEAISAYIARYADVFDAQTFTGKKIVFYQHSAVGRDSLVTILERLGAEVVPVGRSEKFIPIDTENVTPQNQQYFKQLAQENPGVFAIVSTDGDSDRPFVIDENGVFHRGDVLGAINAEWAQADFAAMPVSASDASDTYLKDHGIAFEHTKIGSPYVVVAMKDAVAQGATRAVGWEVNGGFMLGCDLHVDGKVLKALPTRDAILPIIGALLKAVKTNQPVSAVFDALPKRYTQAGLINNFATEISKKIVSALSDDTPENRATLQSFFTAAQGFGKVTGINGLDGVRIFFDNGDVAHLRPSGNAPQLRIYSVANTQERADKIVAMALAEPDGILRQLETKIR